MRVRGPNNVGRAVQTDSTLLRYASAITQLKKCWELLALKFDGFQTLRNDRAEQRRRMCRDGRGVGSKLVSLQKDFQNILTFWRFFRWILNI